MKSFSGLTVAFVLIILAGYCLQAPSSSAAPKTKSTVQAKAKVKVAASAKPFGLNKRVSWTTSKITGSPEPPALYKLERAFPHLSFKNPVVLTKAPGTSRLFVAELNGQVYSFDSKQDDSKPALFADLTKYVEGFTRMYGLTFHPEFEKNRYCYISYVLKAELPDGTHVSRFVVRDTNPPTIDPDSEKVIIAWKSGGHNGACIKFSPKDGYLYISAGDGAGAFPPDSLHSGQDVSNLLASVMRIDVDHPTDGKLYSIPNDNPFIDLEDARGEIWSYGHRNPWKMSFDPVTGDLWVGDVGWEMWEMIYRIERGGNYGWSVVEAEQFVHPERKRGPTPILPPTIAHSHTESRSITGGFVYRGKRLKELVGSYIYGDYVTGKIWGAKHDGSKVTSITELVDTALQIVCFGVDNEGELYVVGYGDEGAFYRLVPNPTATANENFPKKLSETGLFASVKDHAAAAGVIPYSINAEPWADNTVASRYFAVPRDTSLGLWEKTNVQVGYIKGDWQFPTDGVLVKTISIEMEQGNPQSRRHLETQVLHFNVDTWMPYTYIWNDEQTDAVLSDGTGSDRTFTITDSSSPNGRRQQTYHFASRTECQLCHSTRGGTVYGFKPEQLNRDHNYGDITDNQLRTLSHIGLFKTSPDPEQIKTMPNPHDGTADLTQRARAYLHVNCAHCHRRGGGGTAHMDIQYNFTMKQTNLLTAPRPTQGTFGIFQAHVFAPGDPFRSVIYYRMAKLGRGRMPHFGSSVVDKQGLDLIFKWMNDYSPEEVKPEKPADQTKSENDAVSRLRNRELAALAKIILNGETSTSGLVDQLLSTTSGALVLLRAIDTGVLPQTIHQQAITKGSANADIRIRDLFERFVPEENRIKRLGSVIKPDDILSLKGDATRGSNLFFKAAGVQCRNCHKINKQGKELGPSLDKIGKKYKRPELLETILEPSKKVEPKFVAYLVETAEGRVHTGLLVKRTEAEIVLKDATNKEIRVPADEIETVVRQRKSLMPELLLREMTAQEVADLLEFLTGLKE